MIIKPHKILCHKNCEIKYLRYIEVPISCADTFLFVLFFRLVLIMKKLVFLNCLSMYGSIKVSLAIDCTMYPLSQFYKAMSRIIIINKFSSAVFHLLLSYKAIITTEEKKKKETTKQY